MTVHSSSGRRCQPSNPPHVVAGVLCANCGCGGHTFRVCDLPITSFGVVCYRRNLDGDPEFLLVQRKDSLCYVEFIRGKYTLTNRPYISHLLSNMTHDERYRLLCMSFDELWCNFWQDDRSKRFLNEYNQSRSRFDALRDGFFDVVGERVQLASLLSISAPGFFETEWGFPKGRRNIDESDSDCALREFSEETGLLKDDVLHLHHSTLFEETFVGSNKVRYRHIYYIYTVQSHDLLAGAEGSSPPRPCSIHQSREIRRVAWFGRDQVLERIRPANTERREMFQRICSHLLL